MTRPDRVRPRKERDGTRSKAKGKRRRVVGRGLAVSPGVAHGRVVVLDGLPSKAIGGTEVVVTVHLKPFIAPFVIKAAAIVTEEGGEFCHAAIIAREIGIPCMVVPDATSSLREGQLVTVDADRGVVYT